MLPRGLPSSWDWRNRKAVTDIKNQGQCGSVNFTGNFSWIHIVLVFLRNWSSGGNVGYQHGESIEFVTWFNDVRVFSQDCQSRISSIAVGIPLTTTVAALSFLFLTVAAGCDGGDPRSALQYIIDNRGVDTEYSYPYVDVNGGDQEPCTYNVESLGARISGTCHHLFVDCWKEWLQWFKEMKLIWHMLHWRPQCQWLLMLATTASSSTSGEFTMNQVLAFGNMIITLLVCGNTLDDLDHGMRQSRCISH